MSFISCIKSIIKRAKTTLPGNDAGVVQTVQVQYLDKVSTADVVNPAGFGHNPTSGKLCVVMNVGAVEDNIAAIVTDQFDRIKDLEPGETVIYNTVTKSNVICKNDGSIVVNAPVVQVNSPEVNVDSSTVNVTSSQVNVDGDLDVTGQTDLGNGGPGIARLGDSVQVVITSGSSAGTWNGVITSASNNNTAN